MTENKYLATVAIITSLIFFMIVSVNYIVNPIGIYQSPLIKGFNDVYPAAVNYARLKKIENIKHLKPDALIIGTSRADVGLDPKTALFPGLTPYNAALSASTIYEQRRMLEFAQAVHPLKKVIITLDFFSFNARILENKQFDPKRLDPGALSQPTAFIHTYDTIASLDTFVAALKHLRYIKRLHRQSYSKDNGHKADNDVAYQAKTRGAGYPFWQMQKLRKNDGDDMRFAFSNDYTFTYSDQPGDTTFQHLEAMLDLARQNHMDVILVLSPVHVSYLQTLEKSGANSLVSEWKQHVQDIAQANALRYKEKPYPLWDFAYRNSLTTERIPAEGDIKAPMKWYWDPIHYKKELGDIVLRKVLGRTREYPDFGRRIF